MNPKKFYHLSIRFKLILLVTMFHIILCYIVIGSINLFPSNNAEASLDGLYLMIVVFIYYKYDKNQNLRSEINDQLHKTKKAEVEIKKDKTRLKIETEYRNKGYLVVTKHNYSTYKLLIYAKS